MIGRKCDAGESGRLRNQGYIAAPVIEDRIVSWNAKMPGSAVHGIQKEMLYPQLDERQDTAVGNGLERSGTQAVRDAATFLKEIRQPGRLHNPDERNLHNTAGDGN